jgi:hypothetical protein
MRRGWSRMVWSGAICAVAAALVVTGCSSNEAEDGVTAMESTRVASMVLPIASYMLAADEYAVVQRAHGIIEQKCMAERGFDWIPPAPYTGDVFGRQVNRRYRYVLDSEIAAEFGYHVVGSGRPEESDSSLSDAELVALSGDDEFAEEPGGCMGAAIKQLSGGMKYTESGGLNLPYPVHEVNFASFSRSQQDPRVRAALDKWSTCMTERGYEVSDPVNYLPAEFDIGTPEPSTAEIDMALWDVECQKTTDIVRVWFDVDSEIQRKMLGERAEVFARITQENAELLRRATDVVERADG